MPGTKRPDNPLDVLKQLEKRVRILEQSSRVPSLIGAHIAKNSTQIISSAIGTLTVVTFAPPTDFDTDSFFDDATDRFIVPEDFAGYYWIYAKTEWVNGTGQVRSRIRKNGAAITETLNESVGGAVETTQLSGIVAYLAEGDTIELAVSHNQGTNRSIAGDGTDQGTYIGMVLIGK